MTKRSQQELQQGQSKPKSARTDADKFTRSMSIGVIQELVASFLDGRDIVRACSASQLLLAQTGRMRVHVDHCIDSGSFMKLLHSVPRSSCYSRFQIVDVALDQCSNESLCGLVATGALDHVEDLDLAWSLSLTDLSPLSELSALRALNMEYCSKVDNLLPLASCKALTMLNLNYCTSVESIRTVGCLDIKDLLLAGIAQQEWVPGIQKSFPNLSTLDLSCTKVNDVSCLAQMQMMRELRICQTNVTDVHSLKLSEHLSAKTTSFAGPVKEPHMLPEQERRAAAAE
jgi:hypothetical protein